VQAFPIVNREGAAATIGFYQRVSFLGRRDFDRRLRADFDEKAKLVKQFNIKAE